MKLLSRAPLLALLLLLAGCSAPAATPAGGPAASPSSNPSGWDQILAAARREGTVTVYGTDTTNSRAAMVDEFQKVYPDIRVEAVFAPAADRVSRLKLEREAGRYLDDLWISGITDTVTTLKDAHWTVPLKDQLVLPEVLDENNWFQRRLAWADTTEPYTTFVFLGDVIPVLFVNPKLVDPSSFKSYWDLLDPKWRGKIASTDIRMPGKGADVTRFLYKNPDVGPTFFTQLFSQQDVHLSAEQRQLIDWVATGTYPIGIFLASSEVQVAMKQGLPIAIVPADQFKEGGSIGPGGGGIAMLDHTPHPNAAKAYLNWLLSKQGQTSWQKTFGDNSLRTDIPKDGLDPAIVPKDGAKYTSTGTEEYSRLQSSVIKQLIDDALAKKAA